MTTMHDDPIVSELRAAGASLVLALAAAQNGDWPAAEQGTRIGVGVRPISAATRRTRL